MTKKQHRSNSFVLRVWWEEGAQPDQWRGWIQHAATGATRYFRQVADLLAFIEARTGPLAQDPSTKIKREGGSDVK